MITSHCTIISTSSISSSRSQELYFTDYLCYLGPFPGGLCCICKLPLGQTRQCSQSNCQHSFHVLCLWYSGGDMTIELTNHEYVSSGIQPQLIAYCPLHSRVFIFIQSHVEFILTNSRYDLLKESMSFIHCSKSSHHSTVSPFSQNTM